MRALKLQSLVLAGLLFGAAGASQAMTEIAKDTVTLEGPFLSAAGDTVGGSAFFGGITNVVSQEPFATFGTPQLLTLAGLSGSQVLAADGAGKLYAADEFGSVERIDPVSLVFSSASLSGIPDEVSAGVIDPVNGFLYLGTAGLPGQVIKVRTSDLVAVSSLTLNTGEGDLASAVIDTVGGFAYFGSSTTPGQVSQIRLSDFKETGHVTFASGEGPAQTAIIDVPGGTAYFGTGNSPGGVIRISLGSLKETGSLTLNSGENSLVSALFDPAGPNGYFGTNTSPGIVVQVALAGMTRTDALTLSAGSDALRAAVIDQTNNFGYFGTFTQPDAYIVKVDLYPAVPVIQQEPSNASAPLGQSVSFSVKAYGRGISYQWFRGTAAIGGATAAAYSFTPTLADSGAMFSCTVTNANGSAASQSATLTVIPVVSVYPNPWRADRGWPPQIHFKDLAANSTIKIFTLSAHWVKSIAPAGSSAVWDLTNDAGQNVASGYYFYLITTPEDDQTVHGKLAVIR